jgi:hypothetical protein
MGVVGGVAIKVKVVVGHEKLRLKNLIARVTHDDLMADF